jgi:hypothetical protein
VERPQNNRGATMSEREITSLNISVYERVASNYMADNTTITLNISTHLRDGNILSSLNQHLTLEDAKSLAIQMTYAIAEAEAKLAGEPTLSKERVL